MSCLHAMFESVARRTPDATALIAGDVTVRYQDLNQRADTVARRLRVLGVEPEMTVAVRLGRSVDLVVALLAVLKSGGVYVPIEPAFPPRRCREVLALTGATVLVTTRAVDDQAATGGVPRLVFIDGLPGAGADENDGASPAGAGVTVRDTNLAYVTLTSGSSGVPKAVATTHASAATYLRYLRDAGHLAATDTVLQLAAMSFDASLRDLLGPLTVGAAVVLVPDELVRDPAVLRERLVRHAVTCVPSLVPSTLRLLCEPDWPPHLPRPPLRRLLVSGEVLPAGTVRRAREQFGPELIVVNHYGPTECTMTSTFHPVEATDADPLPIGRTPAWGRMYLMDESLRQVPPGSIGEIYLGGAGVARGYLADPALTAARFLPDPFGADAGARMYRTGDLGRLRPDGVLEFYGRTDAQMKVNGVRVDPVEVEAKLRGHESVAEAAAAVSSGSYGGDVLVAYIVASPGHAVDIGDLRRVMREELPEALVPKVFVELPALPRNARGKIDRAALPAATVLPAGLGPTPRSRDEAIMLSIWREVAGRPDLGVHDDLFALGGDSILLMTVASRIRREFGRAPTLAELFREPTAAAAARLLPEMPDHAPDLHHDDQADDEMAAADRTTADEPDRTALSFAQERLWFFDQLLPGSPLNTIACAFRCAGLLDRAALGAAVEDVLRRHDTLRVTLTIEDGVPRCRAVGAAGPSFSVVPVPPGADAGEHAGALARVPIDLERGPLLHVAYFDGADAQRVLLVRVHHLVADARSLEIVFDDLAAAYRARCAGTEPDLPSVPARYGDYAAWQRRWLTEERTARHVEFWRGELENATPLLDLPTDRPRPAVQRYQGSVLYRRMPPTRIAGAAALAREEGASLFMLLLTTWAALLSRYSGAASVVVGVPVSGRTWPELDRVVGLFVNTLPVQVDFTGTPTFRQLLGRVRDALLRVLAHREYPFERLVEQLRPERSLAYGPVFQTLADLQHAAVPDLPGAALAPLDLDTGTARFDISLSFLQRAGDLVAAYTFDVELFDGSTVERMGEHFDTLLDAALAGPDCAFDRLRMMTEAERVALTVRPAPRPAPWVPVPDLIASQIRQCPDRIAVTCGEVNVTYGALGRASAHVADRLAEHGIGERSLVAICADRSAELVAGLVGIHRLGAAYLPMDPTHPVDRLTSLVAAGRPDLLLASPDVLDRISSRLPAGARVVPLDDLTTMTRAAEAGQSAYAVQGVDLAYVIHTSGSTGAPKGVEVTHRGLAHVLREIAGRLSATPADTLVAITTVAFDIAALELMLPLTTGGRVVLATQEVAADPVRLRALLRAEAATMLQATPATWQLLADLGDLPMLRVALCGGEPLPLPLAARLRGLAGRAYNVYGPTETTIWSTMTEVSDVHGIHSIGEPIGDTAVLVFDSHLQPVPVGVAGEIYLGGSGVARGYRDRPDLTVGRFLPDPWSPVAGGRLYRTGDRGRFRRDGRLEYLGRVDRQIKLRGFRIEPAEVERVLTMHPCVSQAVVCVRSDTAGGPQLVAYVTGSAFVHADALRLFLTQRLPQYLVPSVIVALDTLPLTANGKIEMRALPALNAIRPYLTVDYRPAADEIEKALAGIWSQMLGVDRIGLDDDFFALGGHSLLAVQVIRQVNQVFGSKLPLCALFAEATIGRLARLVTEEVAR